jgi:hypothetical protein
MITREEFAEQGRGFTRSQIDALTQSDAYHRMMEIKGGEDSAWNWQKKAERTPAERAEEQIYLQNVERISHLDDIVCEEAPADKLEDSMGSCADIVLTKAQSNGSPHPSSNNEHSEPLVGMYFNGKEPEEDHLM